MKKSKNEFYYFIPNYRNKRVRKKIPDLTLRKLVEILESELRKESKDRTARAYHSSVKSFLEFYGKEDFYLNKLNSQLLIKYEDYLLSRKCSLNTVSFYMRNLRAIYNKGIKNELVYPFREDYFRKVYTGVQSTRKKAINSREIRLLADWVKSKKTTSAVNLDSLTSSAYYFLFCFYARGMSYVDMAYLKKRDIKDGVISYRRKKTGQYLEIKLLKEMKEIIAYFAPYVKHSSYLFPIIREAGKNERVQYESGLRVQNKYLKHISKELKFRLPLSTHVARHTWATIAKKETVALPVISESLGHTSLKTTAIYLAGFENSVLDEANIKVIRAIKRAV